MSTIIKNPAIYITGGGGITPSGSVSITENGNYDVTEFAAANVNVPQQGIIPSGNKEITATTETQTGIDVADFATVSVNPTQSEEKTATDNGVILPSTGKLLSKVTVNVDKGITPTGNLNIQATQYRQTDIDVSDKATVSIDPAPTEVLSVTENGSYTPSVGKTFSSVLVNVPAVSDGKYVQEDLYFPNYGLDSNLIFGRNEQKKTLFFKIPAAEIVNITALYVSDLPTHNIVLYYTGLTSQEIENDSSLLIGESGTVIDTITPSDFSPMTLSGTNLYVAAKFLLDISNGYILADTYQEGRNPMVLKAYI